MEIPTQLVLGLAILDAVIIAVLYQRLRSPRPMDVRNFSADCAWLSMFAVHALFFYKGVFLILQLGTIAAIFALSYLQHIGKLSKGSGRSSPTPR